MSTIILNAFSSLPALFRKIYIFFAISKMFVALHKQITLYVNLLFSKLMTAPFSCSFHEVKLEIQPTEK
jgi:hypothetical protein